MSLKDKLRNIDRFVIYPTLGISRVGNSDEWFFAPEIPGRRADPRVPLNTDSTDSHASYKDSAGAIKRQAARFRVYGLDDEGKVVAEINSELEAEGVTVNLNWKVHLANRKAAWYEYINPLDLNELSEKNGTKKLALPPRHRNISFGGVPYGVAPDQKKLVIDARVKSISGNDQSSAPLDEGQIMGRNVYLGELKTDDKGRLIVLGGKGKATSLVPNNPIHHFANNEGWYDDTSDGTVRVEVKLEWDIDGVKNVYIEEAEPAFVAVVPPNYGQGLYGTVTMYDVVQNVYYQDKGLTELDQPSFKEHIWPIFQSLTDAQWVSFGSYMLFGEGSPCNFCDPDVFKKISLKSDKISSESDKDFKKKLFSWFRNPSQADFTPTQIPSNYGDALRDFSEQPNENLWVTETQYGWLKEWSKDNFIEDMDQLPEQGSPLPGRAEADPLQEGPLQEGIELNQQPHALTKAALEECLGGPFRPGIEISWPLRVPQMWKSPQGEASPFRLNIIDKCEKVEDSYGPVLYPDVAMSECGPVHKSGPGTLTRWMGVPWQADAASCLGGLDDSNYLPLPMLWSPRAPQEVLSEQSIETLEYTKNSAQQKNKAFNYRQFWLRDLNNTDTLRRINDMAQEWADLGIIAPQSVASDSQIPEVVWSEQQRGKQFSEWDPTYLQLQVAEGRLTADEAKDINNITMEEYAEQLQSTDNVGRPHKIYSALEK